MLSLGSKDIQLVSGLIWLLTEFRPIPHSLFFLHGKESNFQIETMKARIFMTKFKNGIGSITVNDLSGFCAWTRFQSSYWMISIFSEYQSALVLGLTG